MSSRDALAEILWEYHQLHHVLEPVDAVFLLGNSDIQTAERGAEVYLQGVADTVLISGGFGKITKDLGSRPKQKSSKIYVLPVAYLLQIFL